MKTNVFIVGNVVEELKKMPSGSVDLIVTSPPYNCGIKYDSWNDSMVWEDYLKWNKKWLKECYRVLKDDGRIAINALLEMGIENNTVRVNPQVEFAVMMKQVGLNSMGLVLWEDLHRGRYTAWGSWMSASSPYIYNMVECIMLAYKKNRKKLSAGEDTISKEDFVRGVCGIWKMQPETSGLTKACFPLELPKLLIELLSYKEDVVLDPFSGSGTTALAAKRTDRKYIGIDISEEYTRVARKRLAEDRNLFDWLAESKIGLD